MLARMVCVRNDVQDSCWTPLGRDAPDPRESGSGTRRGAKYTVIVQRVGPPPYPTAKFMGVWGLEAPTGVQGAEPPGLACLHPPNHRRSDGAVRGLAQKAGGDGDGVGDHGGQVGGADHWQAG